MEEAKMEEYELFVEDTARFSERRQNVSNIYVTVNSIILAAVTFVIKDSELDLDWRVFLIVPIFAAGIFVCIQWIMLIKKYKALVSFRIKHLKKMEDEAGMEGCHKMFQNEREIYPVDGNGHQIKGTGLNFSDLETWLPIAFVGAYIGYIVVLAFILVSSRFFPEIFKIFA